MNNFSKEFCWTIKRFYPVGISIILLEILVKKFKFILPPILESGYVTIIQIIITALIIISSVWHIYKIKSRVKKGLRKNEIITFGIILFVTVSAEAGANSLAANIFLISLFGIAYMGENQIRDQLLFFANYIWGLLIVPFVGWYFFIMLRKYITTKLDHDTCTGIVCWGIKNWIWSSLFILIIFNLCMIFQDNLEFVR